MFSLWAMSKDIGNVITYMLLLNSDAAHECPYGLQDPGKWKRWTLRDIQELLLTSDSCCSSAHLSSPMHRSLRFWKRSISGRPPFWQIYTYREGKMWLPSVSSQELLHSPKIFFQIESSGDTKCTSPGSSITTVEHALSPSHTDSVHEINFPH